MDAETLGLAVRATFTEEDDGGITAIVTVSAVLVTVPSLTVSEKVRVAALAGAVKVGFADVVLERTTPVPPVCDHR